jgi:hypothetical protein
MFFEPSTAGDGLAGEREPVRMRVGLAVGAIVGGCQRRVSVKMLDTTKKFW